MNLFLYLTNFIVPFLILAIIVYGLPVSYTHLTLPTTPYV